MTIKRMLDALLSKLPIIIIVTLIAGVIGGCINYFVLPEKYTATATFYVLSKSMDYDTDEETASYNDLKISNLLVMDYNVLATSRRVKDKVAANVGLENLQGFSISVSLTDETRVMKMSVTCQNPTLSARVANEMVNVFSEVVGEIMNVENVNVVDEATVPTSPSSPKKLQNTILIMAAGFGVAVATIVIIELLDNTVRNADDVEENFGVPVLAQVGRIRGTEEEEKKESVDKKKKENKAKESK